MRLASHALCPLLVGLVLCAAEATESPADAVGSAFDYTGTVVLPCSKQDKSFFISHGTRTLHLVDKVHWPKLAFGKNDVVHVRGHIVKNGNRDCSQITVVGKAAIETPADISIAETTTGKINRKFVRLRGHVRNAFQDEIDPEWAYVTITQDGSAIPIVFMPTKNEFKKLPSLVDADICVMGIVCGGLTPDPERSARGRRIMGTATVYIRSLSDIDIVRPAPADPFSSPRLGVTPPVGEADTHVQRRTVSGFVLATYDQVNVVLQEESGAIVDIGLANAPAPSFGMKITAVGFPESNGFRPYLADALWRENEGQLNPEAGESVTIQDLTTDDAGRTKIKPAYHGRAVKVRGFVRTVPGNASGRMIIENNGAFLSVDAGMCPQAFEGLQPGCLADVSGICVMPAPVWHPGTSISRISDVFLVPRTVSDICIIRHPPWWTVGRLLVLVSILILALVGILVWNRALHIVAERRGRALLREKIGHVRSEMKTQERTRLAVELHDALAQSLTGAAMELEAATDRKGDAPADMLSHIDRATKTITSCRGELRNCLWDLRSRALEEKNMASAIIRTLQPHVNDSRLAIRFDVPRSRLTDNTAHALLRIVREFVLNALRHGKASAIRIAGTLEDDELKFSVADNGCGFDPDTAPGVLQGHFGLQGIRERVRQLGGSVRIVSTPGSGTKATVHMKVKRPEGDLEDSHSHS